MAIVVSFDDSAVPGSQSIKFLFDQLISEFGREEFIKIDQPSDEVDAIGWRLESKPLYLFSVSTHAGELPEKTFDLQVSISDDSLENGDIVFGIHESTSFDAESVCAIVAHFKSGKLP